MSLMSTSQSQLSPSWTMVTLLVFCAANRKQLCKKLFFFWEGFYREQPPRFDITHCTHTAKDVLMALLYSPSPCYTSLLSCTSLRSFLPPPMRGGRPILDIQQNSNDNTVLPFIVFSLCHSYRMSYQCNCIVLLTVTLPPF